MTQERTNPVIPEVAQLVEGFLKTDFKKYKESVISSNGYYTVSTDYNFVNSIQTDSNSQYEESVSAPVGGSGWE